MIPIFKYKKYWKQCFYTKKEKQFITRVIFLKIFILKLSNDIVTYYEIFHPSPFLLSNNLKIFSQMLLPNTKIIKSGNAEPDQFEMSISNALLELEMNSDLKSQLRELYITKAREIEANNKKVKFY